KWPKTSGLALGVFLGSLTLFPYIIERLTTSGAPNSFLTANIHFDWVHFSKQYKILSRVISFPSGETTRFIGGGGGIVQTLNYIKSQPILWLPFAFGFPISIWISWLGLKFFFRPRLYQKSWRIIRSLGKKEKCSGRERFELVYLWSLFWTMLLFLF